MPVLYDAVWRQWVQTSTTADCRWQQWFVNSTSRDAAVSGYTVGVAHNPRPAPAWAPIPARPRPTPEQVEAERQRRQFREEADARANRLFLAHLTPEERHCYERYFFVDILVPSGRIYRIHRGSHGNVREMVKLPDGQLRSVASLCCQPEGVPLGDVNLAQLLWLKTAEAQFRRVANITPGEVYRLPPEAPTPAATSERHYFNAQPPTRR